MMRTRLDRLIWWLAPVHRKKWAQAMQAELAAIANKREAMAFAFGCLIACCRFHLERETLVQKMGSDFVTDRFSVLALGGGLAAGLIGLTYLLVADAPPTMVMVNGASILIGIFLALGLRGSVRISNQFIMIVASGGALILLATATFGFAIDETRRWLAIGPFFIQTSLILLPMLVTGFARLQNHATLLAIVLAASAMAIQPDRAMAAMLFVAVALVGLFRPGRLTFGAALFCAIAFGATMLLPDRMPAVPFVDHILWTAFDIDLWVGLALWAGCLMLVCPIILVPKGERTVTHYVFAGSWLTLIAAAAMGAYPTPIVGYGASAIIGYFLSLIFVQPAKQARLTGDDVRGSLSGVDETNLPLRNNPGSFAI